MSSLAVVMPAFNEEGLAEFLAEIETHLLPLVNRLEFVVVDDASPRTSAARVLKDSGLRLASPLRLYRNPENLGHGPSALLAYRAGLSTGCRLILHVDGDGQFHGADMARMVRAIGDRPGVLGVRTGRVDPWFRRVLTRCARVLVMLPVGRVRDANTPLRLYRAATVAHLVSRVEELSLVPHLQFSILEKRAAFALAELEVGHRLRRGSHAIGTTWQQEKARLPLPTARLLRFSLRASVEVLRCWNGRDRGTPDRAFEAVSLPARLSA